MNTPCIILIAATLRSLSAGNFSDINSDALSGIITYSEPRNVFRFLNRKCYEAYHQHEGWKKINQMIQSVKWDPFAEPTHGFHHELNGLAKKFRFSHEYIKHIPQILNRVRNSLCSKKLMADRCNAFERLCESLFYPFRFRIECGSWIVPELGWIGWEYNVDFFNGWYEKAGKRQYFPKIRAPPYRVKDKQLVLEKLLVRSSIIYAKWYFEPFSVSHSRCMELVRFVYFLSYRRLSEELHAIPDRVSMCTLHQIEDKNESRKMMNFYRLIDEGLVIWDARYIQNAPFHKIGDVQEWKKMCAGFQQIDDALKRSHVSRCGLELEEWQVAVLRLVQGIEFDCSGYYSEHSSLRFDILGQEGSAFICEGIAMMALNYMIDDKVDLLARNLHAKGALFLILQTIVVIEYIWIGFDQEAKDLIASRLLKAYFVYSVDAHPSYGHEAMVDVMTGTTLQLMQGTPNNETFESSGDDEFDGVCGRMLHSLYQRDWLRFQQILKGNETVADIDHLAKYLIPQNHTIEQEYPNDPEIPSLSLL